MELRLDHDSWLDASRDSRIEGGVAYKLDWRALAIRLAAGHGLARALAREGAFWAPPVGSFDPAAARQINAAPTATPTQWGSAPADPSTPAANGYFTVNPVALGDSKSPSGKDTSVAGPLLPAIEG